MVRVMLRCGGAALAWTVMVGTARADIPPDDGTRFAGYGFRVDNLEAFPEFVVLAYPWSLSNGSPTTEVVEVKAGEVVGVGRRSDTPMLYAMGKADYAAWQAENKDLYREYDPRLDELFKSGKVRGCGATVQHRHYVPMEVQGDILDVFTAEAIDAGQCRIVAVKAKTEETVAAKQGPGSPEAPPPAPAAAGCTVAASAGGVGGVMFAVVLLGLRRRRG